MTPSDRNLLNALAAALYGELALWPDRATLDEPMRAVWDLAHAGARALQVAGAVPDEPPINPSPPPEPPPPPDQPA